MNIGKPLHLSGCPSRHSGVEVNTADGGDGKVEMERVGNSSSIPAGFAVMENFRGKNAGLAGYMMHNENWSGTKSKS